MTGKVTGKRTGKNDWGELVNFNEKNDWEK